WVWDVSGESRNRGHRLSGCGRNKRHELDVLIELIDPSEGAWLVRYRRVPIAHNTASDGMTRIFQDGNHEVPSNPLSLGGIEIAQAVFRENHDLESVWDSAPSVVPIKSLGDSSHDAIEPTE